LAAVILASATPVAAQSPIRASPLPLVSDAGRGERLYESRCGACHSLETNRVGPRHGGVFGRRVASVKDYRYSPALQQRSFVWDERMLDRWLENPTALVPGTAMGVRVSAAQDRVDIIAYPKEAQNEYLFASSVYSTVLAYRTDVFAPGKRPKGWAEFWDVKRFPGPRSMRNHPVDNLEFALFADGVPADKLYPIDMDRAFKKLDEIKPHVNVWWTTGQQPAQLLLDKEVVLATGWNGRFYDLMKKEAPIAVEWKEGSLKQGTFVIPKGAKDLYWSNKMLAYMSDPRRQAIYANELGYPGLNLGSIKYIDPRAAPHMPTHPDNLPKQFWLSAAWWDENMEKSLDRWKQWLLKK
jgi:cytochrome c2